MSARIVSRREIKEVSAWLHRLRNQAPKNSQSRASITVLVRKYSRFMRATGNHVVVEVL